MRRFFPLIPVLLVPVLLTLGASQAGAQEQQTLEQRIIQLEKKIDELSAKIDQLSAQVQVLASRQMGELIDRFGEVADKAKIGAAKAELANIKMSLGMFQAESDDSAYPRTAQINTMADLRRMISPYVRIPDEDEKLAFTFVSYASPRPDEFMLTARARDSERTVIKVTPTSITP